MARIAVAVNESPQKRTPSNPIKGNSLAVFGSFLGAGSARGSRGWRRRWSFRDKHDDGHIRRRCRWRRWRHCAGALDLLRYDLLGRLGYLLSADLHAFTKSERIGLLAVDHEFLAIGNFEALVFAVFHGENHRGRGSNSPHGSGDGLDGGDHLWSCGGDGLAFNGHARL